MMFSVQEQNSNSAAMGSDLLRQLQKFPSPFFWSLDESMFDIVHEKLIRWKCTEADRLACKNTSAFLSYARDKDPAKARRQFQEVLGEDPENLVALTSLAYMDIKRNDVTSAETKRKTLSELMGSGGETQVKKRWALAMFEKAFCLTRFGQRRHREALGCIEEALQFDSGNKEWLKAETFLLTKHVNSNALARVRLGLKTFLDRAADNVFKLQQMEPGSGEVLCMKAELFEAAGSTEEGLAWKGDYKHRYPKRTIDPSVIYEEAYNQCPKDQSVCRKAVLHLSGVRNWIKMEKIAKKALEDFPNDPLLYHQLGLRYLRPFQDALMKEKTAPGKAKKAAVARVKETSKPMYRAEEYFQKGLRLADHVHDFTRCRISLARCLYYQGKVLESWEQFRVAAEKAKDKRAKDEARREWARLLIEEGNHLAALMQLCEACLQDERDPVLVRDGATFAQEALEIDNNTACETERGKAAKHKNPIESLDPTVPFDQACSSVGKSICEMAVLHLKDVREWQKMEEILKKALKRFPNDPFLYHQYGLRYLVPYELALAEAKESKDKADACAKNKDTFWPEAKKYFQKALKIDPLFTRCRVCLARCLYYQGKVQESWQQFRIAAEDARDASSKIEARREWARLLIHDGNEAGALKQLCEALKLKDQGVPFVYQQLDSALNGWCKYNRRDPRPIRVRAALALEAGNEDMYSAIEYYKEALQIDADDTNNLIGLEKAYKKKGSKVDRHDPRPIRVRAALALEAGNENSAIEYYKEALQIDADDTNTMIGLEKAYRKKGNFREAKKWFQKASRLGSGESNDH
ncbi:IFIT5 [Branchiostoma lanceolatum]|uniref:IFIT5 protein n=1 Tax=Branchiostoma lanceolatum TaxID=7740 RepID=A0A8J9ZFN3_BRALA|nr:IFIT5 [Branchiostoma lanceolatum]